MVPAVSPVILLEKLPLPLPICTLLFDVVGVPEVLYTIPRSVTVAPPSFVIFPPRVAEVALKVEIELVVIVGAELTGIAAPVSMSSILKFW